MEVRGISSVMMADTDCSHIVQDRVGSRTTQGKQDSLVIMQPIKD